MRPTYVSPSIERQLGYTVDEAMTLSMESLFAPDSYQRAMQLVAAELVRDEIPGVDPGRTELLEVELVHRDGRHVPFEIHYSALRDADGKPAEIVAIARDITSRRAAEQFRAASAQRMLGTLQQTVRSLAALGEMRDSYTAAHQQRVADLAHVIGTAFGLDAHTLQGLKSAGLIHDIGKVRVPAEILTKPGGLSFAESEIMKTHPAVGYEVLSGIDFPWPIAEAVFQHHERLDGSGYPRGLVDSQIIPEARILAVADVVEAIASARPYRAALGTGVALREISSHKGTLYDASVVDACIKVFQGGYRLEKQAEDD